MVKCKDCVHVKVCNGLYFNLDLVVDRECRYFKSKNKFVEVVHCKDCIHRRTRASCNGRPMNFFCADGKGRWEK